jgi:hypothetical protein
MRMAICLQISIISETGGRIAQLSPLKWQRRKNKGNKYIQKIPAYPIFI